MKLFIALFIIFSSGFALFEHSSVDILRQANFEQLVGSTQELWLVVFHNNDQATKNVAEIIEQTGQALRNMGNVGATSDESLISQFSVTNFPSIRLFALKRDEPIAFEGDITGENLVNFVFDNARNFVFERIGSKIPKKKEAEVTAELVEDDVIVLDDDNFTDTILNSEDAWMVEFYAPWCDHCKKLAPDWAKLGTMLKGEVKVAKIDSSKNTKSHEKYKVKGYPSIKFFPAGEKLDGEFEDYDGAREANSMATWAREAKKKFRPLYFEQLLSQDQLQKECLDFNGVCVIFFIPHLYECGRDCRNNYLKTFKDAVIVHKSKPFNYFWSQGADQYDFEENFSLGGAGYPSVLALSPKKSVFSKMRAQFSKDNVDKFIQNLVRGKEQVAPYRKYKTKFFIIYSRLVQIKTVKPWDGEEYKSKK